MNLQRVDLAQEALRVADDLQSRAEEKKTTIQTQFPQGLAAQADAESFEQQVILQVWQSYQSVKTAEKQVGSARDLLASARQSAEVADGRYKAGVGSILDLLTAQTALANARAQEVQARANWLLSITSLAHDTGSLGPANNPEAKR